MSANNVPGTIPAGSSRSGVGPAWLQNSALREASWEFARDNLLGIDDFRSARRHLEDGNLFRAGVSGLTGAGELGLTALALFPGTAPVAAPARAVTLASRVPGGTAAGRRLWQAARAPFGPGRLRPALTQAARAVLGQDFDDEEAPAETPDEPAPEEGRPEGPPLDWDAILGGFVDGGTGGGVSVPSGLFRLSETQAEQDMLARELADVEARREAGEVALRAGWGEVQAANAEAARKARAMVGEVGDTAAGYWTDAAQTALDSSALAAQQAGGFEGRSAIDISPTAGSADWVGFMESQAPSERRLAERQQEMLGEDLEWMAGMAAQQGEAYVGDLQRQAQFMSFERAREHNLRVQDRINQERMLMAQMQMQAQTTNAQLAAQTGADPYTQFEEDAMRAFTLGDPSLLANKYNIPLNQAEAVIERLVAGLSAAQGIRNQ